jgi:hypothetical protein
MNKHQLALSRRGVRLLTGHLRGKGDSLDQICADKDAEAASSCADPLVQVAAILLRRLRTATNGTIETALGQSRLHADSAVAEYWPYLEAFFPAFISGRVPPTVPLSNILVALTAQDIATCAAAELAVIEGVHPNAVVARLRKHLREQGEDIQFFDRQGVERAADEYAADPELQELRRNTAATLTGLLYEAAHRLNEHAQRAIESEQAVGALNGLAQVAVIAGSLGGGVVQLVHHNNLYPAWSLLRQIVETEFLLWKFANEPASIVMWSNSTKDERERDWKPSRIYRDLENEYRQKDYSRHCELGGHPTPAGANLAGGVAVHRAGAGLLCDLIGRTQDAWSHFCAAVELVDQQYDMGGASVTGPRELVHSK